MKKLLRWLAYGVGALAVLLLVAAGAIHVLSNRALAARATPRTVNLAAATPEELANGRRSLDYLGCIDCHGAGMTGKTFHQQAGVGTFNAPNITRLAAGLSDAQFEAAIRQGIGHDGRALFIMPSKSYQTLTDGEVRAIIAAVRALPVRPEAHPVSEFGPIGRFALAAGKIRSAPAEVADYAGKTLPHFTPDTERGRHIAEAVCADCHGPLLGGQEVSPGINSANLDVAAGYDLAQFATLMKTGVPPSGKDLGLMTSVSRASYAHLTDAEIASLHAYLTARAAK